MKVLKTLIKFEHDLVSYYILIIKSFIVPLAFTYRAEDAGSFRTYLKLYFKKN